MKAWAWIVEDKIERLKAGLGAKLYEMTVPDQIKSFLVAHGGKPFCDDCLTERIGLPRRQQVQQVTSTLSGVGPFIRNDGVCSICGHEKKVAQAN